MTNGTILMKERQLIRNNFPVKGKNMSHSLQPRFYLLIGEPDNWKVSISKKIWGFTENSRGQWRTTSIGEPVGFYITKPIQKLIGFGKITDKFYDEKLIWNDEILFKRSLWKYKLSFNIIHVCKNWDTGIELPKGFLLGVSRKVVPKNIFLDLVCLAEKKWKIKLKQELIGDRI